MHITTLFNDSQMTCWISLSKSLLSVSLHCWLARQPKSWLVYHLQHVS